MCKLHSLRTYTWEKYFMITQAIIINHMPSCLLSCNSESVAEPLLVKLPPFKDTLKENLLISLCKSDVMCFTVELLLIGHPDKRPIPLERPLTEQYKSKHKCIYFYP